MKTQIPQIKRMLTTDDVAELAGVSPQTVRRWWKAGEMPAPLRCGRRAIRWTAATIEEWIQSGCTPITEPEEANA